MFPKIADNYRILLKHIAQSLVIDILQNIIVVINRFKIAHVIYIFFVVRLCWL